MYSSQTKTVIVTGSNKGIGYEIVKRLLTRNSNFHFIMAVRNTKLGQEAAKSLANTTKDASKRLEVAELDISNSKSIDKFIGNLKNSNRKIDILINNAAIASLRATFGTEIVETTFKTNYYGTIELTEKMKPYLKNNGRIIMISSMIGKYKIVGDELKKRFSDKNLTKEKINQLAKEFYDSVKDNTYNLKGFPQHASGMTKLCINTYTRVLSQDSDILERNIQVYACCPGYCRTDMTNFVAPLSAEQGAETPSFLAELDSKIDPKYQGQFFSEKAVNSLWGNFY